ncbi:MAG: tyrosine-type recombinase/integrase, partial [Alphaproteobacteria bacterium]
RAKGQSYVAERKQEARIMGKRYPLTESGVKSAWKFIRKNAGVTDFRFHDFRHDYGTKLLRHTGNLKLVSRAMNHADLKTTSRYAHVLDGDIAAALESFHASADAKTEPMHGVPTPSPHNGKVRAA